MFHRVWLRKEAVFPSIKGKCFWRSSQLKIEILSLFLPNIFSRFISEILMFSNIFLDVYQLSVWRRKQLILTKNFLLVTPKGGGGGSVAELLMHWTCNLVTHWIPSRSPRVHLSAALYKKPTGLRLPVGICKNFMFISVIVKCYRVVIEIVLGK